MVETELDLKIKELERELEAEKKETWEKRERPSIQKEVVSQILSERASCTLFIRDTSNLQFFQGNLVCNRNGMIGDFNHY